jgi:hypothetical protein
MTVEDFYRQLTDVKSKCTWFYGKLQAAKRQINVLDFRKTKAKSWEKDLWQAKLDDQHEEIKRLRSELHTSLKLLKQFVDEHISNIETV